MKVTFLTIGKTVESYLKDGISIYEKRLKNYLPFEFRILPELKKTASLTFDQQKNLEGKIILSSIQDNDHVILLDEKGKDLTSKDFANFVQKGMLTSIKSMIFVVGGPYGFSKEVYDRANDMISLSKMTFSHQMVRLIFVEQLYRAMTILNNEPYHH